MKIAIFNNWPHQYMGGVESYTRRLIKIFQKQGWDVTEFSTLSKHGVPCIEKPLNGVKQVDISNNAKFYRFNAHKEFNKIIKENKYDVIINNSLTTRKSLKSNKVIAIQHMEKRFYSFKNSDRWFSLLNSLFLGIGSPKTMIDHKNVVYFTEYENPTNKGNPLYITTPLKDSFDFKSKRKVGKEIFWLGRLEEPHKGLKNLVKIFKDNADSQFLRIGGDGPDAKLIKDLSRNRLGSLNQKEVVKTFESSKVFIMTSNSEGFPLVAVEALASGVPVIMFNSFNSAKFFNGSKVVRLIKRKDIDRFKLEIKKIIDMPEKEYLNLSKKCTDFAKDKFSKDNFEKKWLNYINKIKSGEDIT